MNEEFEDRITPRDPMGCALGTQLLESRAFGQVDRVVTRAQFRPLADRILVKRLDYKHEMLEVVGVKLDKGLVVAVGPGRRRKRKTKFEGMPGTPPMWFEDGEETGAFTPMDVKVGDVVEFSPRQQFEFTYEGEKYVMVWRRSCYCIDETKSQSDAFLWQESAGFDRNGNFMSGAEEWQRGR